MPDYKKMYQTLFRSMTKAITILQEAQQVTEEMYISSASTNIRVIDTEKKEDEPADTQ